MEGGGGGGGGGGGSEAVERRKEEGKKGRAIFNEMRLNSHLSSFCRLGGCNTPNVRRPWCSTI